MRIFKHVGISGSCIIVSTTDMDMAKQAIRSKLDSLRLGDEELDIVEISNACTLSSFIHIHINRGNWVDHR